MLLWQPEGENTWLLCCYERRSSTRIPRWNFATITTIVRHTPVRGHRNQPVGVVHVRTQVLERHAVSFSSKHSPFRSRIGKLLLGGPLGFWSNEGHRVSRFSDDCCFLSSMPSAMGGTAASFCNNVIMVLATKWLPLGLVRLSYYGLAVQDGTFEGFCPCHPRLLLDGVWVQLRGDIPQL